ncbi:MAG: DUF1570 domain-containing protein [Acidobacteria bacterium]|nr:DUF1570 domain-containing protein [Acidobacteriota bacterium]
MTAGDVEVLSDTDAETTIDFATKLQRMRGAMAKVSGFPVENRAPARVFLFRNGAELEPLMTEIFGTEMKRSGVFTAHGGRHDIAIDASAQGRSEQVMYHEVTHSLAHSAWGPTPLWLDEGLAEFYSTFSTIGNDAFVGKPPRAHILRMLRSQPIRMSELLAADIRSDLYTSPITQRTFYAQAWAIVHLILRTHPRGSTELSRYVELWRDGVPPEVAFERAFAIRVADVPRTLRDYMRRVDRAGWFRMPVRELTVPMPGAPHPIANEQFRAALDELTGRSPAPQQLAAPNAVDRANVDLAFGRLDDAIATLRFVADSSADEAVRTRAAQMAEQLEGNRIRNRHVELYNAAIDRAEGKDFRGALAILDSLLPELTDEDICASAGALQAEIRRVAKKR